MPAATPFLMFEGDAEEAVAFYVSVIPGSAIISLVKYEAGVPGPEGKVFTATFTLAGREFRATDSPVEHAFGFTPALSIFVDLDDEAELDSVYEALLEEGAALMPLGDYGFSQKFGWVNDRFGVSWQLNLPS